jgi:hypothetical protein
MLMLMNNIFLTCALLYLAFQGNALLDRGVAQGKITPEQAAGRKKWLRPASIVGAIGMLLLVISEIIEKH